MPCAGSAPVEPSACRFDGGMHRKRKHSYSASYARGFRRGQSAAQSVSPHFTMTTSFPGRFRRCPPVRCPEPSQPMRLAPVYIESLVPYATDAAHTRLAAAMRALEAALTGGRLASSAPVFASSLPILTGEFAAPVSTTFPRSPAKFPCCAASSLFPLCRRLASAARIGKFDSTPRGSRWQEGISAPRRKNFASKVKRHSVWSGALHWPPEWRCTEPLAPVSFKTLPVLAHGRPLLQGSVGVALGDLRPRTALHHWHPLYSNLRAVLLFL